MPRTSFLRLLTVIAAAVLALAVCAGLSDSAFAASKTLAAGETLNLTTDLVLSGLDALQINGTPEKHCTITATSGARIVSDNNWAGSARISYCDFKGVGTAKNEAIRLRAAGSSSVAIDHCTFNACGMVRLDTSETGTFDFRANTLMENCLVTVNHLRQECQPSFQAECRGTGRKIFAGNHVYKALCEFSSDNILIGGDKDEDSNFLIGNALRPDAGRRGYPRGPQLYSHPLRSRLEPGGQR